MKFLLASTPLIGHVNPVINVGKMLVEAGHEVVFTSASEFRVPAEEYGLRFVASQAEAATCMSNIDTLFPERQSLRPGPQQMLFAVKKIFCDPIEARYADLLSILETFPADVIVVDCSYGGTLSFLLNKGEKRPAIVHVGIGAFPYHRDDCAPFGPGLPPVQPNSPESEQYRALASAIDSEVWSPAGEYVADILRRLGADPLPMSYLDSLVALPDVYVQPGSPSVEIPRKDLPKSVHCIGVLPSLTQGVLPESAERLIQTGKTVIVVAQDAVSHVDLTQLLEPTLEACSKRKDLVVVATTSGRSRSMLRCEIPENAVVLHDLPIDELLKYATVLVINGSYGTVCRSLFLGVPMVIAGKSEDKAEVAMHVANANIGINLLTGRPTPAAIREAIDTILKTDTYRNRSRAVAEELAGIDTRKTVVHLLEQAVLARTQEQPQFCYR
jgi:UDP:flavonoid glycosyltransferase YjiC (YdhE family)